MPSPSSQAGLEPERTGQAGVPGEVQLVQREVAGRRVHLQLPGWAEPAGQLHFPAAVPEHEPLDLQPRFLPVQGQPRLPAIEDLSPQRGRREGEACFPVWTLQRALDVDGARQPAIQGGRVHGREHRHQTRGQIDQVVHVGVG